jgi:hypothetical protein
MLLVAASVMSMAASATGRDLARTDGNDTPGPLDLASVRVSSINDGDRIAVRTQGTFTANQLDGSRGWFEVDFDTDADKDVESYVVMFFDKKGTLHAYQFRNKTFLRGLSARREDRRTVSFSIAHRYLGKVKSYDFVVFSVWRANPCSSSKPCVDTIPNRYPLIRRDWTPPTIEWKKVANYSTAVSETLTFPVRFLVEDNRYGTGIDHWTLRSSVTSGVWTKVRSGHTAGTFAVDIDGQEGTTYRFRLLAVDKAGNKRTNTGRSTSVPLDDRNGALDYSSATQLARADAFLGTISQVAQGETLTFTYNVSASGGSFCLLGGPPVTAGQSATATVMLDGVASTSLTESDTTPQRTALSCVNVSAGSHTWVVTTTSAEPVVIDGVIADAGL